MAGATSGELTLDPSTAAEWDAFRALAHRVLDDALDYQQSLRDGPAWRSVPAEVKLALDGDLPVAGVGSDRVYEDFKRLILPFNHGNAHPRHWGWVNGQGTPLAALADMLAATMNPNCWGGEHAASYVEAVVLKWLRCALGLPSSSSGLLVSGGSMANLIGIAAGREAKGGQDVSNAGLRAQDRPLTLYMSHEAHNSLDKAVALLGIGSSGIRRLRVDGRFRMDVDELRSAIRRDRSAGLQPFCVVATAGTVNTGAIDPIAELADLCEAEDLWLHVDGAFGAMIAIAPELRPQLAGLDRAHSVAFDLHKWMYFPIDIGCVLIRDAEAHRAAFERPASYLQALDRGIASGEHRFTDLGPELTRPFRALKAWMCLRAYGMERYQGLVRQNLEQAQHLFRLVEAESELEALAPVPLNIVCFRYSGEGDSRLCEDELNTLNRELLMRLWESGVAAPSGTVLDGRFVIRCAFTNHRTQLTDLDLLLDKVVALGRELMGYPALGSGQGV